MEGTTGLKTMCNVLVYVTLPHCLKFRITTDGGENPNISRLIPEKALNLGVDISHFNEGKIPFRNIQSDLFTILLTRYTKHRKSNYTNTFIFTKLELYDYGTAAVTYRTKLFAQVEKYRI